MTNLSSNALKGIKSHLIKHQAKTQSQANLDLKELLHTQNEVKQQIVKEPLRNVMKSENQFISSYCLVPKPDGSFTDLF